MTAVSLLHPLISNLLSWEPYVQCTQYEDGGDEDEDVGDVDEVVDVDDWMMWMTLHVYSSPQANHHKLSLIVTSFLGKLLCNLHNMKMVMMRMWIISNRCG